MRTALLISLIVLPIHALAAPGADGLDDGLDEPIPEPPPEPPAVGPDGTYGRFRDLRIEVARGRGTWYADTERDFLVTEHHEGRFAQDVVLRVARVGSSGLRPGSGAWLWGVGARVGRATGTLVGAEASSTSVGVELILGRAFPLGRHAQLELVFEDELGAATLSDDLRGTSMQQLTGFRLAGALGANLAYTGDSGWQLVVGASARYAETFFSDDIAYKLHLVSTGWTAGVGLGRRM